MESHKAVELARKIIELDILRDKIWENLAEMTGDKAYELIRRVQNS
ncbi:hypothetical protein [Cytobacillus gottheilii]|nr:hypothetical protein [Cytobacillus gottheilii]